MGKIFNAIVDFIGLIFDFLGMVLNGILTLFQMIIVGIPSVLSAIANMPGFVVSGITITISICLCMVLLSRRSS